MKILITGISGFIGNNLLRAFSMKHEIYGLDIVDKSYPEVKKTYAWKELDVAETPDVIIHLAGKAHDVKNESSAQEYFDVNTGLTQKIFDFFLKSNAKKFIFFSSVKAAADFVPGDVLTEEVAPNPVGPYGESKIAAEKYILDRTANFSELENSGKSVYILRPCMIHGPGNKGNLNLLYGVVNKGIPWPLGAFDNKRTFTSIDNLVYIINGLISSDVESGIYNVGDDESLSTNELIGVICKATGRKSRIIKVPKSIMGAAAMIGSYLHLPLNKERLTKLTENYVVSNEKLKKALGIESLPVTASEGLYKTIKSFRAQ